MKYEIDKEEITLRYFTNIDDKETKEVKEILEERQKKLRKINTPFVVAYVFILLTAILLVFFGIRTPQLFIGIGILAIIYMWLELVRRGKINHLRLVITVLKKIKRIAINNDRVRHNEKIRFIEKLRLQELSNMKQEELNMILTEKKQKVKLPPRPQKQKEKNNNENN